LVYVLVGLLSGAVGGLLGLGGAVVLIPLLVLGMGQQYEPVRILSLINNVFVSVSAAIQHRGARLHLRKGLKSLIPAGLAGVVLGFVIGKDLGHTSLCVLAGACLVYVSGHLLWEKENPSVEGEAPEVNHFLCSLVGFLAGGGSSILGVGGGIIAVPGQKLVMKLPLRQAIANSSAMIIMTSTFSAMLYLIVGGPETWGGLTLGEIAWASLWLLPGSFVGAQLGGYLTTRLRIHHLRWAAALVFFYAGVRMVLGAFVSAPPGKASSKTSPAAPPTTQETSETSAMPAR